MNRENDYLCQSSLISQRGNTMESTTFQDQLPEAAPVRKNFVTVGKRGLKNDKKNINPTIEDLREAGANCKHGLQGSKNKNYEPSFVKGKESKSKEAFKTSCVFICGNNQYEFTATDNPTTITGNLSKLILKSKRGHDWTLTESIVSICRRELDGSEEKEAKCFNLDIPAFLHVFSSPEKLKNLMIEMSNDLSKSWTSANGSHEMTEKRTSNELPMILDFRKNPWSKNTTELALTATTFNHTLATQSIDEDVDCLPENVHFQLRYQSDNKPKRGMLTLPRDEWINLINNDLFQRFYDQVWDFLPLTNDYNDRIMTHLTARKPLVRKTLLIPETLGDKDFDGPSDPTKKKLMKIREE